MTSRLKQHRKLLWSVFREIIYRLESKYSDREQIEIDIADLERRLSKVKAAIARNEIASNQHHKPAPHVAEPAPSHARGEHDGASL